MLFLTVHNCNLHRNQTACHYLTNACLLKYLAEVSLRNTDHGSLCEELDNTTAVGKAKSSSVQDDDDGDRKSVV